MHLRSQGVPPSVSRGPRESGDVLLLAKADGLHSILDLGEAGGVVYGGGKTVLFPVGDSAFGSALDLTRPGLGQPVDENHDVSKVSFRAATASSRRAWSITQLTLDMEVLMERIGSDIGDLLARRTAT